MNLKKVVIHIP